MHKANSNMLWFVNILCKIVKSTAVYFSYFVSQALTFFCSLFFPFVLFWGGLALFHPKEAIGLTIFFLLQLIQSNIQDRLVHLILPSPICWL